MIAKPWMLGGPYFSAHDRNRMRSEGDVVAARAAFLRRRPANLEFLLRSRYDWMSPYLDPAMTVVEFGAGAGLTREFLHLPRLYLTDVVDGDWIDLKADALLPPFRPESLDCVICNHMLHHVARPRTFLRALAPMLKPGGLVLVNEPQSSFLLRLILRAMRHEGWSYEVDPFDEAAICNDPSDPWSGNAAIADLLFSDRMRFEQALPEYEMLRDEFCECLVFLASGGVTAKTFTVPLPNWALRALSSVDDALVRVAPAVFALSRRVALRKRELCG